MAIADLTDANETSPTAYPPGRSPHRDLFLVSFLILFTELACIRWFGSTVIFLTFFTNLVLIASFLGMSVGLLTAGQRRDLTRWVLPVLTVAVVLSIVLNYSYYRFGRLAFDVGGQGTPQQIFFGSESELRDPSKFIIPIEFIAGLFFLLIAGAFLGLGQAMGRAFDAIPNRVAAYTTDVLGSLVGIVVFGLASYFRFPPYAWFAVASALCLLLIRRLTAWQFAAQWLMLGAMALLAHSENKRSQVIWSPYYKVVYSAQTHMIVTNNIGHQSMQEIDENSPAYALPHLMTRDAGAGTYKDVMIIGAGSGNDVKTALTYGAEHIDAVEIEPVLNELGRAYHPNLPYDDNRVSIHLDDGRSFVRRSTGSYDLIKYALVDSLVLHSGYSSLRLESFLFTEQAFRDVKARLKPDGVFLMCNFYRQGWVVQRLDEMAQKVFGTKPVVISLPYQESIDSSTLADNFTFVLVGNSDKAPVEAIRRRLEQDKFFWMNKTPKVNKAINGYGAEPPQIAGVDPTSWLKIGQAKVDLTGVGRLPSDDWPFLYLRSNAIPGLNLRGMLIIAVLSVALLLAFAPVRKVRPNGQMFFLGAGFMLLETKGVVHMALLFGSTWIVNSFVFFSILVMILLSNLYVLAVKPRKLLPYYSLLIVALAVNVFVPMSTFLALPGLSKVIASCAVVFVPVFFAGVIFAASFRDSRRPDVDFGSNVGGIILGALSENLSLVVGFDYLVLVAIGYYLLSALLRPRSVVPIVAG